MIIKDFKDLNVKAFDVHCIRFSSNFHVTVAYDVYYADGRHKYQNTSVLEEPHEDFMKRLIEVQYLAKQIIELPLLNLDEHECVLNIKSINYLASSKYGDGVKFKLAVEGLVNSQDPVIINSPNYYQSAPHLKKNFITGEEEYPLQELDEQQLWKLSMMALEAIKLVYYNKRKQPTLDEATEAAEKGGYADELVEAKEAEQDGDES